VHLSLRDDQGQPATFDASRPGRLSEAAGSFAAGVLRHARAMVAVTAPSVVSYLRLVPHRWSAGYAFLGERNREALLRVCPTVDLPGKDPARQLNLEFRAADATVRGWFAPDLLATFVGVKREERRLVGELEPAEQCRRYADVP
jgi:glutamine synthetase